MRTITIVLNHGAYHMLLSDNNNISRIYYSDYSRVFNMDHNDHGVDIDANVGFEGYDEYLHGNSIKFDFGWVDGFMVRAYEARW